MSLERRSIVAVVLCMALLFGWHYLMTAFGPKTPPPQTPTISDKSAPAPAGGQPAAGQASAPAPGQAQAQPPAAGQAPAGTPPPVAAPAPVAPEQTTIVERPGLYRAAISTYGAVLTSFELLQAKYWTKDLRRLVDRNGQVVQDRRHTDGPNNLLTSYRPAFKVQLPSSDVVLPEKQVFTQIADETWPDGKRKLSYALETADVKLVKTFVFWPAHYQVDLLVDLTNKRATPVRYHLELELTGYQDPTQKPGGLTSARTPQNEVVWDVAGKRRSLGLEPLLENKVDPEEMRGDLRWLAIGQQYFLVVAALPHGKQGEAKQARASAEQNGAIRTSAELAEQTLAPGETKQLPVAIFAGPRLPELVNQVAVNGQSAGLSSQSDYHWTISWLVPPMVWVLRMLYQLVHNWALAIVLLTCLVKLLTIPLSHKSMKSMKVMQDQMAKLKPEVDEINRKHGDNRTLVNQEMMALYQRHGINPFAQMAGCLPIFIQMPIYIALYSMLGSAVELYRVPFLWITDMTTADPYYVMPLLMGGLMYWQTKLTPNSGDPQQKMMTTMMPIMFTGFSIFMPAGLTLYMITNTILGMIQQWVVNRGKTQVKPAVATAAAVVANPPAGTQLKSGKPGRPKPGRG